MEKAGTIVTQKNDGAITTGNVTSLKVPITTEKTRAMATIMSNSNGASVEKAEAITIQKEAGASTTVGVTSWKAATLHRSSSERDFPHSMHTLVKL